MNGLRAPTRREYLGEWRMVREPLRLPFQLPAMLALTRSGRRNPAMRDLPVVVLPGLAAGDRSTALLRRYLELGGFSTNGWGFGVNKGNVELLLPKIEHLVERIARRGPVALIGWSLGGILAREIARDRPDLVAHVTTLASPILGPRHTVVAAYYGDEHALQSIEQRFRDRMAARPIQCPVLAFHSRRDGIVHWRACIDNSAGVRNVEVRSTHVGMGIDPVVLRTILRELQHFTNRAPVTPDTSSNSRRTSPAIHQ